MTASIGLAECRTRLEELVRHYADSDGIGTDDYRSEPQWHAMAEAKHLSALAPMRRASLLGGAAFGRAVDAAVERLSSGAVAVEVGAAWGLGFAYGSAPAEEPYTITTAQVVVALLEAAPLVIEARRGAVMCLAEQGLRWLDVGCPKLEGYGIAVPCYSPSNVRQVDNATAYWTHALAVAKQSGLEVRSDPVAAARLLLSRGVPDVGWRYDDVSTRADLLHTCYIASALMAAMPADDPASAVADGLILAACTHFLAPDGPRDHFDVLPIVAALTATRPWHTQQLRVSGTWALCGFSTTARGWSIGELLVVAAAASQRPVFGPLWHSQLRWLAHHAVLHFTADGPFRHTMHLAHGLACVLEVLRR